MVGLFPPGVRSAKRAAGLSRYDSSAQPRRFGSRVCHALGGLCPVHYGDEPAASADYFCLAYYATPENKWAEKLVPLMPDRRIASR